MRRHFPLLDPLIPGLKTSIPGSSGALVTWNFPTDVEMESSVVDVTLLRGQVEFLSSFDAESSSGGFVLLRTCSSNLLMTLRAIIECDVRRLQLDPLSPPNHTHTQN